MKSNLLKKTLAFLLTAMMVLSVLPVYSFAAENAGDDQAALIAEDSSRALSDFEIEVTSKKTSDGGSFSHTANGTATEIVPGPANINFVYNPEFGSVSGSGTAGQNVTVTATAATGSKFLGWTDTNGMILTRSASYTFTASSNDTLIPVFTNPNGEAYFEAGNYISADINKAAVGGTTIVLVADGILGAGNYTIPAGSTLLIPRDDANSIDRKTPIGIVKESNPYIAPTAFRTLKMAEGAKITVNGELCVAGRQYAGSVGDIIGGVYGPVGFIRMDTGSKITVNGGANLYAWGYIVGSGEVEILKNGTVYESFQSTDWRGGTATSALAMDDNNHVFPMTQYYVQNVEVPMKLNAGAFEKGYSCTTINPVSLIGVKGTEVPLIGSGDSNLFTIDSGYIIKDYDENTDRQVYKVYGSLSMKKIKISMKLTVLSTVTLDSSQYVLPITNNLTVEVFSGTINITQDICFLPGSEIIIHKGATGNIANGKSVYIYDLDQWGGFVGPNNATFIPLPFAPGRPATVKRALTDAKIQIDGIVNASAGFLYTTKSGAIVTSTGTGKVVMKTGTTTQTYQISQINTDTSNVAIPVVLAKLQNADGTTTNPTKEINPQYGTIYTYTDGIWVAQCRNNACVPVDGTTPTCTNGVPCKYCGQPIIRHDWDAGTVTAPAECEKEGVLTYTCSVCFDTYTEEIPATGHTEVTDAAVAAECEKTGLTEGKHCSVCNTVTKAQETVPATGHTEVDDAAVAPECEKTGLTAGKHCSVCNKVLIAQETVPAKNHTWNNGSISILPDCANEGEKTFTCIICHEFKTVPIPAIGHNVAIFEIKKPTCTENGLESEICTICGSSFSSQIIPATGHSYKTVVIQPTCTEKGFTTNICECGDYHVYDYTEKTAHIDADGDYYCDYCEEQINSDAPESNCSHICHQEGFFGFIWQIVQFFWKLFGMNPVCECGAAHY